MDRAKRALTWPERLILYGKPLWKPFLKLAVLIYAIRGKYPWWMVTPDDPVSPFGSGTTPSASIEPTQMAIYKRFGRYIGDVVWLGWRNSGFGLSYKLKPDWLKDPNIRYEDLTIGIEFVNKNCKRYWVKQPDGKWLWETQRKIGPFFVLTGYRVQPIYDGALENRMRIAKGLERAPRPAFHPNMDGRPLPISIRTARTM